MWKDFFSYSKKERVTLVLLTILILLIQGILWTKKYWLPLLPSELRAMHEEKLRMDAFRDSVRREANSYQSGGAGYQNREYEPGQVLDFDPNCADSAELVRVGFRSYVIRNILKYRAKGGKFRKAEDLARIYGMSPVFFERIRLHVRIQGSSVADTILQNQHLSVPSERTGTIPVLSTGMDFKTTKAVPGSSAAKALQSIGDNDSRQTPENKPIAGEGKGGYELNATDTTGLQLFKGVGRYTAQQIERYKKQLGGFYSIGQLAEIKGIYPETLARLQAHFAVNPGAIRQLDVNHASLETLRAHPYISFYQARVIVELRKARGGIHSLEELSGFKEFSKEDLARLKWYFRFG